MTVPGRDRDDGNSVNTDGCPSDCIAGACEATATPGGVLTVTVDNPEGTNFGLLTVFVDYPEGLVLLPGFGDDAQVQGAVTDRPAGSQCVMNDRVSMGSASPASASRASEGLFLRAAFRDCANGGPPARATSSAR